VDPVRTVGGAWVDHAVYQTDLLRWILGEEVISVSGTAAKLCHKSLEVEDYGVALVVFSGGLVATLEDTWTSPTGGFQSSSSLVGSVGALGMNDVTYRRLLVGGDLPAPGWVETKQPPPHDQSADIDHLVEVIRGETEPIATVEDAWRNLAACMAFYESVRTRRVMADNSSALHRARQQDSRAKRQRAAQTIEVMERDGEPISFPAVARRAQVSVSLLYADADLVARIATARDRQRQAGAERAWRLPVRSLVTEQSLRTDLANAKDQARRLAEELAVLRDRLSRQLGTDADIARGHALSPLVDQLEQRAAELEADNHQQRQRIAEFEAEVRELGETLDAARAMNRELMNEVNRRGASAVERKSRRPS
jgi:hypothetical protein